MALVQTRQASDLVDSGPRATGVEVHMTHSSDVLSDLTDNAQTQLNNMCHAMSNAAHSFALLRRSLERQLTQDSKTEPQMSGSKFTLILGSREI